MAEGGTGSTVTETKAWWESFDDETKGYITARGLDKKTAEEAVAETIKFHRNAEAKLGAPADELWRWPAADDKAGMGKILAKLGVPADPSGYKFDEALKLDPKVETFWRTKAHELGLPAPAVAQFVAEHAKFEAASKVEAETAEKMKVAVAQDQLKANWGANYDNNFFIANRALDLLGVPREVMNALAERSSFGQVMEGLLKIGRSMGEARLLGMEGNNPGNSNRVLTAEEAKSKKADLMNDSDFISRWGKGDKKAIDELSSLDRIIVAAHQRGYQTGA